jgi:hypothetical protein
MTMVDFAELSRLARAFIWERGGIERLTQGDDEIDFNPRARHSYEVILSLGETGE